MAGDTLSETLRLILAERIQDQRTQFAIALSGGVDSCCLLATAVAMGKKPVVVSYTPDTHQSTDFLMARETAQNLGLKFVGVHFGMDPSNLERAVREVVAAGYKGKMEVESLPPMVACGKAVADEVGSMLTGDQSDGYFMNNNWMSRNYDRKHGIPGYLRTHVKEDDSPGRIDALRNKYYEEDLSNTNALATLLLDHVRCVFPFRDRRVREAFTGLTWHDVNLPRNKEPLREMWSYESMGINVRPTPVNLHRGDSRFAHMMELRLMGLKHLQGSWKSAAGLYSSMHRGEV